MPLVPADVAGNESLKESTPMVTGGGETAADTPADEYDSRYDGHQYDEEGEEEEEEEVVMDEEEMLRMLDQMEPPLSVCQRLFKSDGADGADDGGGNPWLVLTASQRASLRHRGFAVVDGLAPADLAAEAYEEATARAAAGSLAPAHGSGGGGGAMTPTGAEPLAEEDVGEGGASTTAATAAEAGPELTGYVKSVRDDLTAFVSSEREDAAAGSGGAGAIGRTLVILGRLGEDLGRMVRLRGRAEHQLAVYPAGINARYERHRDAYPDDGMDDYDDDSDGDHQCEADAQTKPPPATEGEEAGGGGGSVSFRRITAICYLRGPSPWREPDGGALRLYPPAASTDSKTSAEKQGDSTSVVIKFASQLGISDEIRPQQQQQRQLDSPPSGVGEKCRGEAEGEDEDNGDGNISKPSGDKCVGEKHRPTLGSGCGDAGGCGDEININGGDGSFGAGGGREGGGEGAERRDFIDVAPLAGRAVVFLSGAVEHEVLPLTGPLPRAALTTWFH